MYSTEFVRLNVKRKIRSMDKAKRKKLLMLLGIVVIGFLLKDLIEVWPEAKLYIINANYGVLILSVVLYMLGMFLNGVAWCMIVRVLDKTISMLDCMNIQFTSAFARYLPGGIWGIVGKSVACCNGGVDKSVVYFSILIEYAFIVSTAASFVLLLIPGSGISIFYIIPIIITLVVLGVVILYFLYNKVKKVHEIIELCRVMIQRMKAVDIVRITIIYLVSWALIGGGFMVLGRSFFTITAEEAVRFIACYPVSWVAGFLSPFPNGIGMREWCLNFFLGLTYAAEITILVSCLSRVWATVGDVVSYGIFKLCYIIKKR